jgi:hypothetical protein
MPRAIESKGRWKDAARTSGAHDGGRLRERGPMVRSTGDLERGAADALRPILERTLAELGLGPTKAQLLMRQIAEAYMRGRAEGINVFPHQANRALSAEGIAIALALQHASVTPPSSPIGTRAGGRSEGLHWLDLGHRATGSPDMPQRPAGIESEQEALEVMAREPAHTVTVEVAVDWDDPVKLSDLLAALDARPEPLAVPVAAHVRRRVIGVTMTVKARTQKAAQAIATVALIDEMVKLGLA